MRFKLLLICLVFASLPCIGQSKNTECTRKILAFYTGRNDLAHISFVQEARDWFAAEATANAWCFEATSDWNRLSRAGLQGIDLVIFLDTRPPETAQRKAFRDYMEGGGAWLGFHFAAFALTPSDFPQDWDWYHREFLGTGQYKSNTWRPTLARLSLEMPDHPVSKGLPAVITSAPNEWYRWKEDLRKNPEISILASIDDSSFPLGTGPKPHEIWHNGDYPVVWTHSRYRMVYCNMGHNDMDYEGGTDKTLSSTFGSEDQNRLIRNAMQWLLDLDSKP